MSAIQSMLDTFENEEHFHGQQLKKKKNMVRARSSVNSEKENRLGKTRRGKKQRETIEGSFAKLFLNDEDDEDCLNDDVDMMIPMISSFRQRHGAVIDDVPFDEEEDVSTEEENEETFDDEPNVPTPALKENKSVSNIRREHGVMAKTKRYSPVSIVRRSVFDGRPAVRVNRRRAWEEQEEEEERQEIVSDDDYDEDDEDMYEDDQMSHSYEKKSFDGEMKFTKSFIRTPYASSSKSVIRTLTPSSSRRSSPGSLLASDRRRTPRNDPVNRYHQLQKEWSQSPFLAKNKRGRRLISSVRPGAARRDALCRGYRKQLKNAQRIENAITSDKKKRTHRRIMPSSYVVPTQKRRDALRWNVRARMLSAQNFR